MWFGKLIALFSPNEKFEILEFITEKHQDYIPRSLIESLFSQDSPAQKQSPRLTKTAKQRQPSKVPVEPVITQADLPEAPVREWGVTNAVMQYLEVGFSIRFSYETRLTDYLTDWRNFGEHERSF